jgi:hypothetical protein
MQKLKHQGPKRSIKQNKLEQLCRDLRAEHFMLNAATIVLDDAGNLLDGHHRLQACVKTGEPFRALVARDVPSRALYTIDTGTARSLADTLKLQGFRDTTCLAATISLIWSYKITGGTEAPSKKKPSVQEAMDLIHAHPDIPDSMLVCKGMEKVGTRSHMAFLHWLAKDDEVESVSEFVNDVITGERLGKENPAFVIRERFIKDKQHPTKKIASVTKLALLIKAWNTYRAGEACSKLQWRPFGKVREGFPSIDGARSPSSI